MSEQQYRLTIHLASGTKIVVISHTLVDQEPEEVAAEMAAELNSDRPKWRDIENIALFSGAVSAVEVEVI